MALGCAKIVRAEVVIDTVAIGNPANAGELSGAGAGGVGPDRICGAVGYRYEIGMYEVTAGQYAEFLNAVAATDTHELYDAVMWDNDYGCKIERLGEPGAYTYRVAAGWEDQPVNRVSWGDAARFANWVHNGQPVGPQNLSTTEGGSYLLDGATSHEDLITITRAPYATWVIPSEDEWYKAAYHANDGVTGNYFTYPTGNDAPPSNQVIEPDPGNNANFWDGGHSIGLPYARTVVGEFENSPSPYGAFDMGGNVQEWNEDAVTATGRGFRGGQFDGGVEFLRSSYRFEIIPGVQTVLLGFRLAIVAFTGDLNCDGVVNNGDIDPFVLALTDTATYILMYPDCNPYLADCNSDGWINNADIDAFVTLLTGSR